VCGWQVKLCNPLVTHGPYLSALEIKGLDIYINSSVYFTLLLILTDPRQEKHKERQNHNTVTEPLA